MFKQQTISSIHIKGIWIMLLFIVLFIVLVIHEEYNDFDKETSTIRKHFIDKQKKTIVFDVERVVAFIRHEYDNRHMTTDINTLQKQIIHAIELLYSRQDGTGYIFIYNTKGVKLSDPIQADTIGKNLYNYQDSDGVQVIKELIEVAQNGDGGFVQYRWNKPTSNILSKKISYAKSFEPWKWVIGTGVYLDEVEKLIKAERLELKKRLIKYMMEILSLAVILSGLGFMLVAIVNAIIAKEVDKFRLYFKKASKSNQPIDIEQIYFYEFKQMVKYINRMVKQIHKRKNRLKRLNKSLEKKVATKTQNIAEQNSLLAQEKEFSESIIRVQDSFIKHSIHEINTPLAVIMTHIDIYKMKNGENRYLNKIEAASKMIANIYDDLSYMVKKNRLKYEKECIDMSLFLHERILFFEEIARGNHHTIVTDIDDGIKILFNDIELQRVIDNNLSNSIKYAKKNTNIKTTLKKEQHSIVMIFATNSKMINDTDQIFQAFHRESEITAGFGLGLEIVESICAKEQVLIEVNSNTNRTEFVYKFPLY